MFFKNRYSSYSGYEHVMDGCDTLSVNFYIMWQLSTLRDRKLEHQCVGYKVNHERFILASSLRTLNSIIDANVDRVNHFKREGFPIPYGNDFGISYHPREMERNPPTLNTLCINLIADMFISYPEVHLWSPYGALCTRDIYRALQQVPEELMASAANNNLV